MQRSGCTTDPHGLKAPQVWLKRARARHLPHSGFRTFTVVLERKGAETPSRKGILVSLRLRAAATLRLFLPIQMTVAGWLAVQFRELELRKPKLGRFRR